jgi:hypothetical protein
MKPRRPLGIIRPLAPILGRGRRRWRGGPLVPMIWRRRLRARPAPQRPAARPLPITQVNHFHLTFIRPERSTARPLPPARIDHPGPPLVRPWRADARPLPLAPIHHFNLNLVWPERTAARIAPLRRLGPAAPHVPGGGRDERLGSREAGRLVTLIEQLRFRSAAAAGAEPAFVRAAGLEGPPGKAGRAGRGEAGAARRFLPRAQAGVMRPIAARAAEPGRDDRAAPAETGAAPRFLPRAQTAPMRPIVARAAEPVRDDRAADAETGAAPRFLPRAQTAAMRSIAARAGSPGQSGRTSYAGVEAAPLSWRRARIAAMRAGFPAPAVDSAPGRPDDAAAPGEVSSGARGLASTERQAMRFGFLVWKDDGVPARKGEAASHPARSAPRLPPRMTADAARSAPPAPQESGPPLSASAATAARRRARAGKESPREPRGGAARLWKQPAAALAAGQAAMPSLRSQEARRPAPEAWGAASDPGRPVPEASGTASGARSAVAGARQGIAPARGSRPRAALVWRGEGRAMDGIAAAPFHARAYSKAAAELVWRRTAPGSAPDQAGIFGGAAAAGARPGEVHVRADRPSMTSVAAPAAPAPAMLQPMEINRLVDEVVRRLDRIGRDERMRRGI